MKFTKKGNCYRIIRITGNQDNILGVSFAEENLGEDDTIQIHEWPIQEGEPIRTSKEEILKQVVSGLESVNKSLKTNYKLSKIYFIPSDKPFDSIYTILICTLIRYYHHGREFQEI